MSRRNNRATAAAMFVMVALAATYVAWSALENSAQVSLATAPQTSWDVYGNFACVDSVNNSISIIATDLPRQDRKDWYTDNEFHVVVKGLRLQSPRIANTLTVLLPGKGQQSLPLPDGFAKRFHDWPKDKSILRETQKAYAGMKDAPKLKAFLAAHKEPASSHS